MTVANQHETIEPTSTLEALRDTTRYMGTLVPREEVVQFVAELDPSRVVLTAQGHFVEPPASGFELMFATTVGYYSGQFGDKPHVVAGIFAILQDEVANGGVFNGKPAPIQAQQ